MAEAIPPDQFEMVANNIPILCWLADATGSIFWYNDRWYCYTGTTPDEMAGWGWRSVHHPKTLGDVLERWVNCLATGEPFEMVFPLRGADSVYRPFLTRVCPVMDGQKVRSWFGVNIEISAVMTAPAFHDEWVRLSSKMGEA